MPKESANAVADSSESELAISKPPGVRMIAVPIQKPPYEERAVAPKVFPVAISLWTWLEFHSASSEDPEVDIPHASKKLHETAIRESSSNDDVGLSETASSQVDA